MDLARERKRVGKRQEDIARKVGLSRAGYANIESGKRKPSVPVAMRIASELGFSWTMFFDNSEQDIEQTSP